MSISKSYCAHITNTMNVPLSTSQILASGSTTSIRNIVQILAMTCTYMLLFTGCSPASDEVPSPSEVFGNSTPSNPTARENQPEEPLTESQKQERKQIHQGVDSVLNFFESSRDRHKRTVQEDARIHFRDLESKNDPDNGKYTWKRWQAYDLRYAFFLAAAPAPDDLHFYERHRRQHPTYYEKMQPLVDQSVIYTKHLGGKRYYDKMSVKLSQETFDLIRWDSSRKKYLVNQELLKHIRQMVNGPLPEREESSFNSDPSSLFQPRFNAPPKQPSSHPAWSNYLNNELAQKFWKSMLKAIGDLEKKNEIVYFTNDQYESIK